MNLAILSVLACAALSTEFKHLDLSITARIERATAGQSIGIKLLGSGARAVKVIAWIENPNGSRVDLPTTLLTLPIPTIIEGPIIPKHCGGGTLIVEIVDAKTGDRISTAGSPVKF